ncbi:MAG TPA: UrcA family protein [Chloroflexota bacterium]|jgi:UrcA family protein
MLKFLMTSTVLAVGMSLAGAASAEPAASDQPRQAVVTYADLNLASAAGVEDLKRRINLAAREVCGPEPDIRQLEVSQTYETCVGRARAQAAQQIVDANATTTRLARGH